MKKQHVDETPTQMHTNSQKAPLSAKEFKIQSYTAYIVYVALIEGRATVAETIEVLSPLMAAYGFSLTAENLLNTLTIKMTAFSDDSVERTKKIKSIATFRAFIKNGWKETERYTKANIEEVELDNVQVGLEKHDHAGKLYIIPERTQTCTICSNTLQQKKVNIPVYDHNGIFQGVYICDAMACLKCDRYYLTHEEALEFSLHLQRRFADRFSRHLLYIGTANAHLYEVRNTEYLQAGVSKSSITIEIDTQQRNSGLATANDNRQLNMNEVSFLKEMGYSTKVNLIDRRAVLKKAVDYYGKRKIIDHIHGRILLAEHQVKDYSVAIAIWKSDIEYIISEI